MSSVASPYDAAIEEIEGKIRQLQAALETLRSLRTTPSDGSSPPPSPSSSRDSDTEIRHDTFFGMTIADAARKYLTMVKHTKPTSDISAALERGGLKHASKDFTMTLRSVLGSRGEEFVRVNSDWGLMEWYPGMGRGRKQKAEPAKKEKASKSKPAARKAKASSKTRPAGTSRRMKVLDVMRTAPDKYWTAREVAEILKDVVTSVQSVLSTMSVSGEATKGEHGYRFVKTEAA